MNSVAFLLQFFEHKHLPEPRQKMISEPMGDLARWLADNLPDNPEKTTAIRKLLEAKDCAVRAVIAKM